MRRAGPSVHWLTLCSSLVGAYDYWISLNFHHPYADLIAGSIRCEKMADLRRLIRSTGVCQNFFCALNKLSGQRAACRTAPIAVRRCADRAGNSHAARHAVRRDSYQPFSRNREQHE